MRRSNHKWTGEEEEFIIQNHDKLLYSTIAKKLGLRKGQVKSRAQKLGLRVPDEIIKERRSESADISRTFIKRKPHYDKVEKRLIKAWKVVCEYFPDRKKELISKLTNQQ